MNTHTTTHKAKIRHLCSCLVLCLHLASGSVTGSCEHSVTEEHLLILRKLIMNQVQNGCSITYWFTERQNLSEICYIKAAFPYILVLLNTHFTYEKGSDNYNYTNTLKDMIYNIYSHECVLHINEEIEDNPQKFARMYTSLSREGLEKTAEVLQMYKRLMRKSDNPVDWNCQDEYANNFPESTTATYTQTTGTPDCQCSCQHCLKASSTPTTSSTSPSHTQSGAYIFRNKNESSTASEPAVSNEARNSPPNQIFATPPAPEPFTGLHTKSEHFTEQHSVPVHEESANFFISPAPNLIDNSSNSSIAEGSEPQSITPSSELPSIPTRTVLQSETSQPSEKNNTTLISERNPVLVLAKRSLGSREQETPSVTYSKLLWSWIAETTGIRKNAKGKLLEITPEHVEHNSPPQPQMRHHIDQPLPVFKKIISKETDCKDSKCQKATEDRSDQRSRHLIKRHLGEKEYQFVNIPIYTVFMISSAFLLLLFITALFYCRQQIKDLQDEDWTIHL